MLQDNFELLFFKPPAKLLGTEQVQGSRGIRETKLQPNLPLPPATTLTSQVFKDIMWHSSIKDWFIGLVLDWVLTPVTPRVLGLQKENKLCLAPQIASGLTDPRSPADLFMTFGITLGGCLMDNSLQYLLPSGFKKRRKLCFFPSLSSFLLL